MITMILFPVSRGRSAASDLSYTLTDTVKLHNDGEFTLTIPEEFQEKNLERFRNDTWDLTEYHGGNGLSLAEILVFVEENADVLEKNIPQAFKRNMPQRLRDHFGKKGGDLSKMFLTFNRNENAEYGLVYAIMKDTYVYIYIYRERERVCVCYPS